MLEKRILLFGVVAFLFLQHPANCLQTTTASGDSTASLNFISTVNQASSASSSQRVRKGESGNIAIKSENILSQPENFPGESDNFAGESQHSFNEAENLAGEADNSRVPTSFAESVVASPIIDRSDLDVNRNTGYLSADKFVSNSVSAASNKNKDISDSQTTAKTGRSGALKHTTETQSAALLSATSTPAFATPRGYVRRHIATDKSPTRGVDASLTVTPSTQLAVLPQPGTSVLAEDEAPPDHLKVTLQAEEQLETLSPPPTRQTSPSAWKIPVSGRASSGPVRRHPRGASRMRLQQEMEEMEQMLHEQLQREQMVVRQMLGLEMPDPYRDIRSRYSHCKEWLPMQKETHDLPPCSSCKPGGEGQPLTGDSERPDEGQTDSLVIAEAVKGEVAIKESGANLQWLDSVKHPCAVPVEGSPLSLEGKTRCSYLKGPILEPKSKSTSCSCTLKAQTTICSSQGVQKCDSFPTNVSVPYGILEITGTNLSVLETHSLDRFRANITIIRFDHNHISTIQAGAFSNMTALTNLSLTANRLRELGARALEGAEALRELLVSFNMFSSVSDVTRALTAKTTPRLARLSVGGHNFTSLGPEDFLSMEGVPLRELEIHENNIQTLNASTFASFPDLTRLSLRRNPLPARGVAELIAEMANSSLESIDVSGLSHPDNPRLRYSLLELRPVLDAVAASNITTLRLNDYCFHMLNTLDFPRLPQIRALSMANTSFSELSIAPFANFDSLEQLSLANNYFPSVPTAALIPSLRVLDLSNSELELDIMFALHQYRFRDMANLSYLDLSNNNLGIVERGAFIGLQSLSVLIMNNTMLTHISDFAFVGLASLTELHLSNNLLTKQDSFENTWQGLTALSILYLDNCQIESSDLWLSHMPSLKRLSLRNNQLKKVLPGMFHRLGKLEWVDLSSNQIVYWEIPAFNETLQITGLNLSHNLLDRVTQPMLDDFRNLSSIQLGFNPYVCSCHLYSWLSWYETNMSPVSCDIDDCRCDSPLKQQNKTVMEFYKESASSPCEEETEFPKMLFTMLPVFLSGMVAAVVLRLLYRHRWYLRYWMFKLTSKQWLKRLRKVSPGGFMYDAFVSYAAEDAGFVQQLTEQLEMCPPYHRLCVYERDFEIGNVISECILESINTSRKTILILTDHFAKSHWCRWEMNLVQCRLYEQSRDDLILVKLGKIRARHLTPTIRYLMRTRIYIEWGPSAEQQLLFWERLRAAVRRPATGQMQLPRTV